MTFYNLGVLINDFNRLKTKEINHSCMFEPYSEFNGYDKKHVFYEDIKKEFRDDIQSYGFCPFLPSKPKYFIKLHLIIKSKIKI